MKRLTARQLEVADYIRDYCREHRIPPTRAEIADALGFASANAAQEHLRTLARKGVLELRHGASRGIRLLEPDDRDSAGGIPLIGRVAAGAPLLAVEHVERRYSLDPALFSPRADYLLRVRGESMSGAGIHDRDLLAVHATREIEDGRIAVLRLDDEVTVKRMRRDGEHVRLLSENPAFEPIEVDLARQSLTVEGLAVGVIRPGLTR